MVKLFNILQKIGENLSLKEILLDWFTNHDDRLLDELLAKAGCPNKKAIAEILNRFPWQSKRYEDAIVIEQVLRSGLNPSALKLLHHLCLNPDIPITAHLIKNGINHGNILLQLNSILELKTENIRFPEMPDLKTDTDNQETSFLKTLGAIDLTQKAIEGAFDYLADRPEYFFKMKMTLSRKEKANLLLLGGTRSGKTTLVKLLARKIVQCETDSLKDKRIIQVDISKLVRNTIFRGQFENNIHQLFESLDDRTILFIDEIHTAFDGNHSSINAAHMLKPYLEDEAFKVIGATTLHEYKTYIESDPAFAARFEVITVKTLTKNELVKIIDLKRFEYEKSYQVGIPAEIIIPLLKLTEHFITEKSIAEAAINVLQVACLMCKDEKTGMVTPDHLISALALNYDIDKSIIYMYYFK